MLVTTLATQIATAVGADETPANGGCDLSAGMFGPAMSELLRDIAGQLATAQAEARAYKWGYEYLQSRMESIDRPGWAHDCDGEIQARIADGGRL